MWYIVSTAGDEAGTDIKKKQPRIPKWNAGLSV